jgi:Sulfotransferase domain
MKVNFFIIGTQKGGTTALNCFLSRVDGIQMSNPKEIHFFDNDLINWHKTNYNKIHAHFNWSIENQIRGEATPIYCYWPESLRRIHTYNPEAKIIMLLRHPAHRAHSHWRMEFEKGHEVLDFADAISEKGRMRVASAPDCVHRIFSYVERGFYGEQIKRLKKLFPDQQIFFLRTDELWSAPQKSLEKIARFLGIEFSEIVSSEYILPLGKKLKNVHKPKKLVNLLSQLTSLYAEDIQDTERLTGIPLYDWIAPDYQEPMSRA